MPRKYSVPMEKISVSAVQDLFLIKGATGVVGFLKGIAFAAVDATPITNESIALRISYLGATVTNGSGGSSVTPAPNDPGDPAATFTARRNDTSQATCSPATKLTVFEDGFMTLAGYANEFDDMRFPLIPGTAYVIECITTPTAAVVLNGTATVIEVG